MIGLGLVMKKIVRCPKCGFYLVDGNYCVKCGYQRSITIYDTKKYDENVSDLELYFKDSYLSILHGGNNKKIFVLGPLYLSYRNYLLLGLIFGVIEFFTSFYLAKLFLFMNIALYVFVFNVLIWRFIYMWFFDIVVLYIGKYRIQRLKKYNNYKEILVNNKPNTIWKALVCLILWGVIIYLFVLYY